MPRMPAPVTPRRPAARDELLERLRRETAERYDVAGVLGRGGMAVVYLAHEIALDRKVAIKVLAPELMAAEGAVERFLREARTAAQLDHHQHIIPIYRVWPERRGAEPVDLVYFVMKHVGGGALDAVLRKAGPLPVSLVQTILSQVGSALAYAHRRGVVHRDVKPSNILLNEEGWVMMGDFGIAKVAQARGLTITGSTVGTPTYMSPEQCRAREEITGASDQYSLGIVAYEMLTGRPPFDAPSLYEMMQAHISESPRPLQELRPDCPAALADALMRMLEKQPAHRWPSMAEALTALTGSPYPALGTDADRARLVAWAREATEESPVSRSETPMSPLPFGRSRADVPRGASGGGVTAGQIGSLRVFPREAMLAAGQRLTLSALCLDTLGQEIAGDVRWESSDPTIVAVEADGTIVPRRPGEAIVTARGEGKAATARIRVL